MLHTSLYISHCFSIHTKPQLLNCFFSSLHIIQSLLFVSHRLISFHLFPSSFFPLSSYSLIHFLKLFFLSHLCFYSVSHIFHKIALHTCHTPQSCSWQSGEKSKQARGGWLLWRKKMPYILIRIEFSKRCWSVLLKCHI